jgi:hypothetical protein
MRTSRWIPVAFAVVLTVGLIGLGCGGDDDDGNGGDATTFTGAEEAAALQEEIAGLSDEEQIKRVGAAWADPFAAADEEACPYMHPDVAPAPEACAILLSSDFTGSVRVRGSYAGATVADVTVEGETARAEFTNGELVEFRKDPEGEWKVSSARDVGAEGQ